MFLHPACPCSRASLAELDSLLSAVEVPVTATAVFAIGGSPAYETSLWRAADEMRGLNVFGDGGAECVRFDARTSGEARLYDAAGRLIFRGGLTPGRGHLGENTGRLTVEALLAGTLPAASQLPAADRRYPVYGCPIDCRPVAGPTAAGDRR